MISPVKWKRQLDLLSSDEVKKIHDASLKILEKTGVIMPLDKDKLEKAQDMGVKADPSSNKLFFPPHVIEEALSWAPQTYDLCAPDPENNLPLDGKHGYMTTDGSATRILDLTTHEPRESTTKDLADLTRIADYLPQISFHWPSVSATDKNPLIQPLYEFKTVLLNTSKHIQTMTAVDPINAQGTIDIAQALCGGKEALKENPIISNFLCPISPLSFEKKGLAAVWLFAEAGVPVGFLNMQIAGSTAPITIAGSLAMGNAEVIAGIALLQILYKGAKTFYGSCATTMELKSGDVVSGGPYDLMLQNMCGQMARFYKVPSQSGTFATGSKASDWYCGTENMLSGVMSFLGRTDMMCGAGLICAASVFSIEQMLLDCETYAFIEETFKGIEVNDETLALDVIHAVGPKGHFMNQKHTFKHLREIWQPKIMHRGTYHDYVRGGSKSPFVVAGEIARDILAKHTPKVTYNEKDIDYIINDYEKRVAR
jgi:trimethylamine--corrinoid protein Co-methyltransferase